MHGTEQVYRRYRSAGFADTDAAAVAEGYGFFLDWLPAPDQPLLDFGCGGGEFLGFLAEQNFTAAEGIDYSGEQVERCRQRGLQRVEHTTDAIDWLRQRPDRYAAVVMNDVLEHIPKRDCVATLEAIRVALRPGGHCVIKVPNAANVFGLVARYLDFTHEIAFTETSLRQVLVAASYAEVEVKGLPVAFALRPRRLAYWAANSVYRAIHRAAYVAAVGTDAPTILTKLILARARK